MDPLPDGAHAVGAPLRPPFGRPPLRAHRVSSPKTKPLITQAPAECLTTLPYHPHIQHSYVSTTSVYLQGIDIEEIIGTIHARRAPMMHVSAGLEL
jgi:hypothetical protein